MGSLCISTLVAYVFEIWLLALLVDHMTPAAPDTSCLHMYTTVLRNLGSGMFGGAISNLPCVSIIQIFICDLGCELCVVIVLIISLTMILLGIRILQLYTTFDNNVLRTMDLQSFSKILFLPGMFSSDLLSVVGLNTTPPAG